MKINQIRQEIRNIWLDHKANLRFNGPENVARIVQGVRKKGYFVCENYLETEQCSLLIREVDALIEQYKESVWVDDDNSDHRLYGSNRISEILNEIFLDPKVTAIIDSYEGCSMIDGFLLAARLRATPTNLGSGGGWHRDDAKKKQTKAILYLSDVGANNGPFQYIEGTHKPLDVLKKKYQFKLNMNQNRFSDEEIMKIINSNPEKLKTFTAKAGTLIIADTRGIHRGMPIKSGERYALTKYTWYRHRIPPHISKILISD